MKTRIQLAAAILATCIFAFAQSVTVIQIPEMTAVDVEIPVQVTTNDLRFKSLVVVGEPGPGSNNVAVAYLQFSGGGTNTVPGIPFGVNTNMPVLKLEFGPLGYSASNLFIRFDDTNDGAAIYLLP